MQISRNRKACNSGQGKVVKHVTRPNYLPAGPCVYRNFVPHPPPPSICLCQCIVWDPLASRKLMLILEIWKTIAPFDFIYRRTCLLPLEENGKCATVFCSNTLAMRIYIINFGLETSNYYLFTKQIINTYIVSIHIWVTYIYIIHAIYIMYYEAKLQQAWENF